MTDRTPNPSALVERITEYVDLYGYEPVAEALALAFDREAAETPASPRERVLRRLASALRDVAADVREHLDYELAIATGRVIGRKTRLVEWARSSLPERAAIAFVVVVAVRKSGIRRTRGSPRLTTNHALREAGGLTRYDLVEVNAYAAGGTRLFTEDLPATALECFAWLG